MGFCLLFWPYLKAGMGAGDVKGLTALGTWLGLEGTFYLFICMGLAAGDSLWSGPGPMNDGFLRAQVLAPLRGKEALPRSKGGWRSKARWRGRVGRRARRLTMITGQKGSVAIIAAASILLILGLVGLAVDLGHLYVVKSELRRAADAGARAGVRALFPFPLSNAVLPLTPDCGTALSQGRAIAQANLVEKEPPTIANLQTGSWDWSASRFIPGCSTSPFTNSLTVTVRRDQIPLMFMGVLGVAPVSLQATGTAVMGFVGSTPLGTIPLGVSQNTFSIGQQMDITFGGSGVQNGGWIVPSGYSASGAALVNFINQTTPMQALKTGDTMNLSNGDDTTALHALNTLLAAQGNQWDVYIPVFNRSLTTAWNGSDQIDGFMAFTITYVHDNGSPKYITGKVTGFTLAGPGYGYTAGPNANLNLLGPIKLVN